MNLSIFQVRPRIPACYFSAVSLECKYWWWSWQALLINVWKITDLSSRLLNRGFPSLKRAKVHPLLGWGLAKVRLFPSHVSYRHLLSSLTLQVEPLLACISSTINRVIHIFHKNNLRTSPLTLTSSCKRPNWNSRIHQINNDWCNEPSAVLV